MMSKYSPYGLYDDITDDQDQFKGVSDSNGQQPDQIKAPEPDRETTVQAYQPPEQQKQAPAAPAAPKKTFAQMEESGEARPPMPIPQQTEYTQPGGPAPQTMKRANNGAMYTGPEYYQPDPSKPNYQPNTALPWGPPEYYAEYSAPAAVEPPPAPPEMKRANNGAMYTGPEFYQPDPSKPNYQPNTALPWGPADYYAASENPAPIAEQVAPTIGDPQPAVESVLPATNMMAGSPDWSKYGTGEQVNDIRNRFFTLTGRAPTDDELQSVLDASGKGIGSTSWDDYDKAIENFSTPVLPPPQITELTQGTTKPGGTLPGLEPPSVAAPNSSAPQWLVDLLQGGIQGTNKSDLQKATEAKALDRLNGSSPYGSKDVQDEYNWLAQNIDDDYAMQGRALDNSFANKGLYGSAGKDFHSGRLADLNVGRRSAKETLAQDLATKYATSKGQYDAQAVDQANQIGQTDQANRFAWLNNYFNYGNDAYNHDLATAEFQQRQNESEQDYILRLLQMGYGV